MRGTPVLVHSVTPITVGPAEVARRQARYDALAPAGVRVVLTDLAPDGPRALEGEADLRRSETLVAEAMAAAPACDAVLPDCVLDPAVPAGAADPAGPPVLGLLRLTVGAAVAAGHRIGAVTRNRTIADELQRRIATYGWSGAFHEVAVLDLDVTDIDDADRWAAAMRPALLAAREAGVTAVVNGCSAVDTGPPEPGMPLVLDPIRNGLGVLGALAANR